MDKLVSSLQVGGERDSADIISFLDPALTQSGTLYGCGVLGDDDFICGTTDLRYKIKKHFNYLSLFS